MRIIVAVLVGWLLLAAVALMGIHTQISVPPSHIEWPDWTEVPA